MAWPEASGTRIVFHIGDAPPHGKSGCGGHPFHSMHDDHPAGHPSDLPLDTLFQQMQDKELDYYFGAINTSTDGMLKIFERYYGRPIQSFNVSNPASIGSAVSASVMEMDHYDIVPQLVADKILANAKRPVEEEEE